MRTILAPAYGLAVLRAGFGLYFLVLGYGATRQQWLSTGRPLSGLLRQGLPHAAPGYGLFLQMVVLPHADLFARLLTLSAFAAGLSLLFGFLSPLGALLGMTLSLSGLLLQGVPGFASSLLCLLVLGELTVLLTSSGLVWGFDGIVLRRPDGLVVNRGYSTSALPYSSALAVRLRARAQERRSVVGNSTPGANSARVHSLSKGG